MSKIHPSSQTARTGVFQGHWKSVARCWSVGAHRGHLAMGQVSETPLHAIQTPRQFSRFGPPPVEKKIGTVCSRGVSDISGLDPVFDLSVERTPPQFLFVIVLWRCRREPGRVELSHGRVRVGLGLAHRSPGNASYGGQSKLVW